MTQARGARCSVGNKKTEHGIAAKWAARSDRNPQPAGTGLLPIFVMTNHDSASFWR
jgi:hypothetical protein